MISPAGERPCGRPLTSLLSGCAKVRDPFGNGRGCGADLLARRTPLHIAVEAGQADVIQHLVLDMDASCAPRTFAGRTPLHVAFDCGNEEIARVLFEAVSFRLTKAMDSAARQRARPLEISRGALALLGAGEASDFGNTPLALAALGVRLEPLSWTYRGPHLALPPVR